jgi:hypothetical protein
MRKGIGTRYAPFLFDKPTLVDQRLYLLAPTQGVDLCVLQAYLVSSLFPLALETNADLGPGAGVLTLSTEMLRELPSPDLRALSTSSVDRERICATARTLLAQGRPADAAQYPQTDEIARLDEAFAMSIGLPTARAREVAVEVARLADVRIAKSKLRRVIRKAQAGADIDTVATHIADNLRSWLAARRFPDDAGPFSEVLDLGLPNGELTFSAEHLLSTADVSITDSKGNVVFKKPMSPLQAEVLLRCLEFGRRQFSMPTEDSDVVRTLDYANEVARGLDSEFKRLLDETGTGSRHHQAVYRAVEKKIEVDLIGLYRPYRAAEKVTIGHWA